MRGAKFDEQMISFLRNSRGMLYQDITANFNRAFSTNYSERQIMRFCQNNKIIIRRGVTIPAEIKTFIAGNVKDRLNAELCEMIKDKFNFDITVGQLRKYKLNNGLKVDRKASMNNRQSTYKNGVRKYPLEVIDFIKALAPETSDKELAELVNNPHQRWGLENWPLKGALKPC